MIELRNYSLCFAQIRQEENLFASNSESGGFRRSLLESWNADNAVSRFNREWHASPPEVVASGVYFGELGYVSKDEQSTVSWEPDGKRFIKGSATAGSVSPFVVNTRSGYCCFQLRPGFIRPTSFTKAFQDLLNAASGSQWIVSPVVKQREFSEWRRSVRAVTKFSFRLERPNPNYLDRPNIEQIIEGVHAEVVSLRGRAADGESLNSEDPIFQQALDHVRRRYGSGKITGDDGSGGQSEWLSDQGGVAPEIVKAQEEGEAEASAQLLIKTLVSIRDDQSRRVLGSD